MSWVINMYLHLFFSVLLYFYVPRHVIINSKILFVLYSHPCSSFNHVLTACCFNTLNNWSFISCCVCRQMFCPRHLTLWLLHLILLILSLFICYIFIAVVPFLFNLFTCCLTLFMRDSISPWVQTGETKRIALCIWNECLGFKFSFFFSFFLITTAWLALGWFSAQNRFHYIY